MDPTEKVSGYNLPRKLWSKLNRLRTGQGRCASCLFLWNFISSPACDCGEDQQTMIHISDHCPIRSFNGGITELNRLELESAFSWLENLDLDL